MTNVVPIAPRGIDTADQSQLELLRRMLVPDNVTDDEFQLFVAVANHSGLDPMRRQIYCQKRKGKLVALTGIDGYRAIAARTGTYAGSDDAIFSGAPVRTKQLHPTAPGQATVTVYKIVGGIRCPFTATARWDEYVPPPDNNQDQMWRKMPHNQLAKCAEALALRKAFPEETSGIYVEDAFADATERTIQPEEPEKDREQLLAERYQALPLGYKIAYRAWCQAKGIAKPYDEDALDRLEAKLASIELGETQEAETEDASPALTEPDSDDGFDVDEFNGRFPPPKEPIPEGLCQGCGDPFSKTGEHVESEKHPGYGRSCEPF